MKNYSIFRAFFSILITAAIAATVFLFFSPGEDLNTAATKYLSAPVNSDNVVLPTLLPNDQSRIGLVAGHWGFDSGHLCGPELNNVREVDVNLRIVTLVRDILASQGYKVDLFQEFSSELTDYTALVLLAIHADTCDFINGKATGFKVASIGKVSYPVESQNLNNCLIDRYQYRTKMNYLGNTISSDSEEFYNYDEVNDYTTASIIETGYLNLDYRTLTEKTDVVARGIAEGILCYINNESATLIAANSQNVGLPGAPTEQEKRFILPGIGSLTP